MDDKKVFTSRRSEKILIVDDCRIMREYLRKMLLEMGFNHFIEADNGKETLRKYMSEQPNLVFLDIMLDEEDGLSVFEQLLAKDANAKVAIVSAHSTADNVKKALSLGAKGFLVKPFQPKKLFITLKNMGCQFAG